MEYIITVLLAGVLGVLVLIFLQLRGMAIDLISSSDLETGVEIPDQPIEQKSEDEVYGALERLSHFYAQNNEYAEQLPEEFDDSVEIIDDNIESVNERRRRGF